MEKRGELTTQQIVLLIILITSFVVVLFFLFRLDLGKESKSEICHNSVIMKGSSVLPEESVELKCNREYICITEDGSCEGLTKPKKFEVDSVEEVYEVLADKMAECWWMFGEGKVDYIGDKVAKRNYCSICSQILFDDSLEILFDDSLENLEEVEEGKISKDELYDYLSENEISEGETYSDYLFGTSDIENLKQQISEHEENTELIRTFGSINIGEQYYVVMGITSEIGNTYKWIGVGVGVLSIPAFIASAPVTGVILIGSGVLAGTTGGSVAGLFEPEIGAITVEGEGIPNEFMAPTIQKASQEMFEVLNCKDVISYA